MSGKSFRFSLQSVLQVRKHETEMARRQFERSVAARLAAEDDVHEAERILRHRTGTPLASGATGTHAIRRVAGFRDDARHKLEFARRRLAELARAEDEARRRLVERQRAEETLQQLSDTERTTYDQEMQAAETAFFDEQALSSYNRRNGNPQR